MEIAADEVIRAFRANELGEPGDAKYQTAAADLIANLMSAIEDKQTLLNEGWLEVAETPVMRKLMAERDLLKRRVKTLERQLQTADRQAELLVEANESLFDERELLRKELDEIRSQAEGATEYVLAVVNRELVDKLNTAREIVMRSGGTWPW